MIKQIFNSITPENIKDIPLLSDCMDIFIDYLAENSKISIDIINMYRQENSPIREELIKIYLDDMRRYFTKAEASREISDKIDEINGIYGSEVLKKNFVGDIVKLFNDEHFTTSKTYKQKKGTKLGIEYIYNLVESLSTTPNDPVPFVFKPGEPFSFEVEGSLYREFYDQIVKPLAHPLGFTYIYTQIVKANLHDLYQLKYVYKNVTIEVRCLINDNIVIEPYDGTDVVDIYEGFEGIRRETKVFFSNGSYLHQFTSPIDVKYYDKNDVLIKDYAGHCSLYLDYTLDVELLTTDKILGYEEDKSFVEDFWLDTSKRATIGDVIVGNFVIGGYARHDILEYLEMLVQFNISKGIVDYLGPLNPLLGFMVGSSTIGTKIIGGIKESRTAFTTDFYDIQASGSENFSCTTVKV